MELTLRFPALHSHERKMAMIILLPICARLAPQVIGGQYAQF